MSFFIAYRRKLYLFLAVCFTVICFTYATTFLSLPKELTLFEGEEYEYRFNSPFLVNIKVDREGVVNVNRGKAGDIKNHIQFTSPVSLKTLGRGSVNLKMLLFGLIPVKTMKVDIVSNKKVVACGNTVGVKLKIDGILVIGMSDVETVDGRMVLPARDTGLKPGDLIMKANGADLDGIDDLMNVIESSNGDIVTLEYKRGSEYGKISVKPVRAVDDNKYHIGAWVRDSTAGIGTLTFYDPETKNFGALGHGITDIDTGSLMPVSDGEILESNILGVKKGKAGMPGELRGVFLEDTKLGSIYNNCSFGIYGKLNDDRLDRLVNNLYPIALRSQIKEGPAVILANIDGKKVEEYDIEIQKVARQSMNGSKGMVIRITDKRLLNATGGIVQGMSGSPIIQNRRIVGAVTHVLVNDPTRGYGIFIEGMIKNITQQGVKRLDRAG